MGDPTGFKTNADRIKYLEGYKDTSAAKQEQKMSLDYELFRIKNCAELQQKGFMLLPGSRIYNVCSDVIPIAAYKKAQDKVLLCASPKPWWKPWHNPNKQVPCPLKQ